MQSPTVLCSRHHQCLQFIPPSLFWLVLLILQAYEQYVLTEAFSDASDWLMITLSPRLANIYTLASYHSALVYLLDLKNNQFLEARDVYLEWESVLNSLKNFEIMSHEGQGGVGQEKWRGKGRCFRQQKQQEERATSETQPVNSLTRPQHRTGGWRNN